MKKLLTILLVIPCFSFFQCQTQTRQSAFASGNEGGGSPNRGRVVGSLVSNINSLISYHGDDQELTLQDEDRGGVFKLVKNSALKNDDGMVFPAEGKKDMHWVRETGDDVVNLKWYGAKGEGISHYKDDSAALVKAIAFIKSKGGGKLYIPASNSFYGYNGLGILLPDNIEVYGDGDKSEIKHVNPEIGGSFYRGVIFFTTSYGPNNFNGITKAPTFEIQDAKKGQTSITTRTNDASGKWKAGDLIGLGANYFYKNNLEFKARYANFEINEITKVEGNTAYLKYPLSVNLLYAKPMAEGESKKITKQGEARKKQIDETQNSDAKKEMVEERNSQNNGYPVLIDISANKTYNEQFGDYDRISRNIYIHNLKLSQADYNMIKNTPYAAAKQPNNVIGLGGTFESKFDHLTLEGVGTFGGNLWNRCEISNLTIYSQWKLVDLGYGSANTKMHDVNWIFKPTKIKDTATAIMYLDDGTHDIELYNINVSGPWSLGNIIQISGGAHNINIHDVQFNLPQYDRDQGRAIIIKDDNKQIYIHDITFKNVDFKVKNIQFYISIGGVDIPGVNKNLVFQGVQFIQQAQHSGPAIGVTNSMGLQLSDVTIPDGNISISNSPGCIIENLKAPNSNIVFSGPKPQISNSDYSQIKAGNGDGGGKGNGGGGGGGGRKKKNRF